MPKFFPLPWIPRDVSRQACLVFFSSRLLLLGIIFFSASLKLFSVPAIEGLTWHGESVLNATELSKIFAKMVLVLKSADANWYLAIAHRGYDAAPFTATEARNWVFFPLAPLAFKAVGFLTGSIFTGALVLNALCLYASLLLLYHLSQLYGLSHAQGLRAMWFLAFFPWSYFLSAPWSESLFLLLTLAVFFSLAKKRVLTAAIFMALLSASRPTGLLLLPAFCANLHIQRKLFSWRGLSACLLSTTGIAAYVLYLHWLLDAPLAFAQNQPAWGREASSLPTLLSLLLPGSLKLSLPWNLTALNFLALLLGLLVAYEMARRKRYDFALLVVCPLFFGVSTGTLQSLGRHLVPLFPVYLFLALKSESQSAEKLLLMLCAALLCALTLGYAMHFSGAMA